MTDNGGLTVLALTAQNIKRVKLVEIRPPNATGLIKISGKNSAGKSSTIDTFSMLLGGKAYHQAKPIRTGEKKAVGTLVLQDAMGQPTFRVTGNWTDKSYELIVERIGQGKIARPQEFLASLVGAGLGFDPGDFLRQKPKQQVETLLALLTLPIDPRTLDAERKGAYEERTAVNREVKQLEGQLAALVEPEGDVPATEVSVADLTAEYQRRTKQNGDHARQRAELAAVQSTVDDARERVARLETELTLARLILSQRETQTGGLAAVVERLIDDDVAGISEQMRTAEAVNTKVRQKRQRATVVTELDTRRATVTQLTASIEAVDQRKAELLAKAPFPIPGLGFEEVAGEYTVTYNKIPLADLTGSEPILVCTAIAMAANPTVRVILIRDASLLDAETLAALGSFAQGKGYHILTELVGDGDASSFVIADGGVVSGPGVSVPAPEPGAALPW